ncbi:bifunctional UDP-sugar hydrolase/5'-nucleotidase [Leuconostocaceae bacterium ESL0958]|nr:bifunctional UDP-sugar hydrolase/5'-nucleotidase [Leuconostocaceae bacterium ESL0958]
MEEIQLRHTNDLHSHLENWPRIRRYLQAGRAGQRAVFNFDIGDAIDRFHPLSDATLGKGNVLLLNTADYDAVTIGNNEGLGMAHQALNRLYDQANFPVLLANMLDQSTGQQPTWAEPYRILTTAAGTKMAVIGLTAPYQETYRSLGWAPEPAADTLARLLPTVRAQADFVVLLSHLGLPTDRALADQFDVDIILGAHTHHLLAAGERRNGTLLAAAGRYGDHVGQVDLMIDDQHQLLASRAKAFPVGDLPTEPGDAAEIAAWWQEGVAIEEAEPVTQLAQKQTVADQAQACLSALQSFFQLPAAFCSTGLFLKELPAGPVNVYDFLADMPHGINPMKITLTGQALKALLQEMADKGSFLASQRIKGAGFRGDVFGELVSRGLGLNAAGQPTYAGKVILDDQQYALATLDHYRFFDYFNMLNDAPAEIHLELFLRELMAQYYQKESQQTH